MSAESNLIERARHDAGLSQQQLARLAGTSRPTLSAYENGRKSPTLETAERLIGRAGQRLVAEPVVTFKKVSTRRRTIEVPSVLPRLTPQRAFAEVELPLTLNWSEPGRIFHPADRRERARLYEIVLREGAAADILAYIDGALLVDLWPELVLPREIRGAWQPLLDAVLAPSASSRDD